jgi:hypothetical protein
MSGSTFYLWKPIFHQKKLIFSTAQQKMPSESIKGHHMVNRESIEERILTPSSKHPSK